MKHLYFVRHGESVLNLKLLAGGYTDTPLTAKGKVQASEAGKLAREQSLVFDVVLSSPLSRAHDTAKYIAVHVDYPVENIVLLDQLKERNFGDLEQKHLEKDFGITFETYSNDPFALDHIPNIEKIIDFQYRANKFLEYLKSRPEETILIVSHGAFGRALVRAIENAPLTEFKEPIENAKMMKLI
jgi:probable phosphoglycerate mutase